MTKIRPDDIKKAERAKFWSQTIYENNHKVDFKPQIQVLHFDHPN